MKKLAFLVFFSFSLNSWSQFTITTGGGSAGVSSAIAGPGLTISGITINCPNNAYGSFSGGTGSGMGMSTGLVMTTGNAASLPGTGNVNDDFSTCNGTSASDPQLTAISSAATNDPCIIEFDVVPQCNNISITFVFGSDEYTNWVSAGFNDVFGFFVSGPNPSGGSYSNLNIATIPGGTPVSIDNVNHISNTAYFVNNNAGTSANHFDGFTTVLTPSIAVTPCATYHIKLAIADAGDCIVDSGVLIDLIQCTSPWTVATSSTPASCGASNGTATATVSGGIGPFTYSWSPGGATTATATGLAAGTYTVTVNDGLTCTPPQVYTVTVGSTGTPPTIGVTPSGSVCAGSSMSLTATGGTSYTWSPATGLSATTGATVTATPGTTTTYTVTGTGACGTGTASTTVTVNPIPAVVVPPPAAICAGSSATLTASGASTYTWSPSTGLSATTGASVTASPGATTTYTVTGTSAAGCVNTTTVTLTVNPIPTVSVSPAGSSYCAGTGGSVVLTASGATTYTWSPSTGLSATTGTSVTASPASTTTYTVTGTSAGCSSTATATVVVNTPTPFTVPATTICSGSSTTLTASNASLVYTWSPSTGLSGTVGQTVTASPTTTTTYTVTGTNGSGCLSQTTVTVTVNPIPTVSVPPASICSGGSTTLTASGASTYTWSPATGLSATTGTSVTANPASTTTYTVTGTSAAGCVGTTTVTLTVGGSLTITVPPASICIGTSTSLTATGGTTYTWSPATGLSATTGGTVTASPSATTTYTINGTDPSGCSGTTTTTVTVNPLPPVAVPAASICTGSSTTLTATGASTYTWSPATGLSATTGASVTANPTSTTTYTVTGTSAAGCVNSTTVTLTVNPLPTISVNSAAICVGSSATLSASGASTYTWSPATGLSATTGSSVTSTPAATTTYTITGTDVNGCVNTATSTVTINSAFDATIAPQPALCQSSAPVTFTAVDAGGTWSATCGACINSTTGTFDPSLASVGTNTITYTIPGSCGDTDTETITVNADADATINPAGPLCLGGPVVTLVPVQAGGTWSATCGGCINATTGDFDPSLASVGLNTVTYTIGGACGDVQTITIDVQEIIITSTTVTDVLCNGGNGSISVNAPGAVQYSDDGGILFQASNNFTEPAGTYTIVVENAIGCQATTTVTINEPTPLTVPTSFTDETCFGSCDGIAGTAPAGGTSPYSYSWSNGAGNVPFATGLCSGVYTVTVTDDNGCVNSASITISGPVAVTITGVTIVPTLCNGSADGSLTVNATGSSALQYSIGGPLQSSTTFNSLTAGTYNITVEDAAGCQAVTTAIVTEPTPVSVVSSPDVTICIGQTTPFSVTASGGVGGYNYAWTPVLPNSATQTASPITTTTYTVIVTDANGCGNVTESITVTVNPPLSVIASPDVSICPGDVAPISASGSGGDGNYNYTWSPATGLSATTGASVNAGPSTTTTYTVTLTDGCGSPAVTDAVVVNVFPLPAVTYAVDNTQGCSPVPVNFTNTTVGGASSCLWDFGDGTTSTNCNEAHVYTTPGCYNVTLTMTTIDGCNVDTTVMNQVCVFDMPVADFSFGPQPASIFNPEVFFTNLTLNGTTYTWDFAGLGTSTLTNPTFMFPADSGSSYNVCLMAVSDNGCTDVQCHDIIVQDEFLIYVPNTFTPDGDGVNDVFIPIIQGENPLSYQLLIFNRWGEVIFESNNKQIGWDGMHKSVRSKEDVYVWKVRVKKAANEDKMEFVGHVNLLR